MKRLCASIQPAGKGKMGMDQGKFCSGHRAITYGVAPSAGEQELRPGNRNRRAKEGAHEQIHHFSPFLITHELPSSEPNGVFRSSPRH